MKKIIAMITCLIILTCMLVDPDPIEVHAEESSDEWNDYYIDALCSYSKNGTYNIRGYYYKVNFSIDKKIAAYIVSSDTSCVINFLLFDDTGVIRDANSFLENIKGYCNYTVDSDGVVKYGDYRYEYDGSTFSYFSLKDEHVNNLECHPYWDTSKIEDSGFYKSNIPYFSSKEECLAYISGDLSVKNAINYESDICDILYDLEAPKNLKIKDVQNTGTDGYFLITWEQTDENYKNWQTEIYRYVDFRHRSSVLIFSWADWKYVDDYYVGQTIIDTYKLSYKHHHLDNLDDEELSDRIHEDYPNDYGGIYEYQDEKIYMRNYYYDGTYRHYSNWLVLEFDSEEDAWINPEMNSTVVEKEGSELDIDDNGVPIQPDSNVVQDSEYTGGVNDNYERVDGTDLISWIKNGFGLGGENGVLGMMGESFSFIPGELWAVFAAGISMMVVVAVFKFIRG